MHLMHDRIFLTFAIFELSLFLEINHENGYEILPHIHFCYVGRRCYHVVRFSMRNPTFIHDLPWKILYIQAGTCENDGINGSTYTFVAFRSR